MKTNTLILPQYGGAAGSSGKEGNLFSFYNISLTILALATIFGILIVKSRTSLGIEEYPLLFFYSVLITTFQFARMGTVLFYKSALKRTLNSNIPEELRGKPYRPFVSFVIPCMNEEAVVEQTVLNCFKVEYPMDKLEVLIIDDGSTDRTPEILDTLNGRFPNLTVIKFPKNRGKRHAMVEGFTRAKGEIIIQLDSDSRVDPVSFVKMVEPFRNPQVGAVCAHADPDNNHNFVTRMQSAYYYMSFRILKAVESTFETVFCCSGCAASYRKSAVMPILDEWASESFLGLPVMYGDDRSLTTQVIKNGYKTIYVWDAQAYTIVPENFRRLMIQQVRWKKSWISNAFKTGRFIFTKRPLVALFYFYPLILISFLNPFIAIYAMIYTPIVHHTIPMFYIIGLALVNLLMLIYYRLVGPKNRDWPYLIAWGLLSVFVLTFLMIYAAIRIQNRTWGTR